MKFGKTKSVLTLSRKVGNATTSPNPQASTAPIRTQSINWQVLDNEHSIERGVGLINLREEDKENTPTTSPSTGLNPSIKWAALNNEDGYTVVKRPVKTSNSRLQKIVFPRTERPKGTIIGTNVSLTARTIVPERTTRTRRRLGTRAVTGRTTKYPIEPGLSVESLRRGAIIEYIDTREYNNKHKENPNDGEIFTGPDGQRYLRKPRFWIVTSKNRYAWHVNTVPIYSYRGQGCAHKAENVKREHVGIVMEGDGEKQSEHEPLRVAFMKARDVELRKESVVHFTERHCFDFGRRARLIGYVEEESMERLEGLCWEFGC